MWSTIATGLAGLVGLVQSGRTNSRASRIEEAGLSAQDRALDLAEETAENAEAWRLDMVKWWEDQKAAGAYSPDAMIERAKQDIADTERRGMSTVNSQRRSGGYRDGDSVVDESRDRVAIEARRLLTEVRPLLERQAREEEFATLAALSPNPALANIYQNNAGMQMNSALNMSNLLRSQAGNPATFLSGIMPLLQGGTTSPLSVPRVTGRDGK